MASSTLNRWVRPEVLPLFAAVGVAVGICGFQLVRNICINPEVRQLFSFHRSLTQYDGPETMLMRTVDSSSASVFISHVLMNVLLLTCRVNKEGRTAGVLENYAEGERYAEHGLRKLVRKRAPEIMPKLNSFFTNPSK
ncbi:hypothetical protein ZIOFF_070739 [Zingiber officinale]|uniref:NADH-ubiquinone reductase complex 1 MLRQ subunit n=1 Tax=Zingiber officinale TaxID=94328 RepID=A0A8J5C0N4_ZINOF|nr:hypothetical protein ZIOFF_070739 [Zingiber officinale]